MQVSIEINIEQLLFLIKKLPEDQLLIIQDEINNALYNKTSEEKKADYLKTILEAPIMSKDQFVAFKENRKRFDLWRTS
jgi:hypothetical protein